MTMSSASSICEFYRNRSVFLTGVTGYMGKVLVEKLLWSCPDIKNIYVLIRSKKDMDVESRVNKLLKSKVFDRIRNRNPEQLTKIVAIGGDSGEPDFNIGRTDLDLLTQNVSIVFNFAASVNFNDSLKDTIRANLMSVNYIIHLCKKMPSLIAFIHLSTAYCNYTEEIVDEIVYPPIVSAKTIIEIYKNFSDEMIEKMTPTLLSGHPNTYTLTKLLAESLIKEDQGDLPVAIVRPSIVASSFKEPCQGWIDTINGFSGIITAAATGLIRNVCGHPEKIFDMVPVDMSVNLIIAVALQIAHQGSVQLKVYNCTTSTLNPSIISQHVKHSLEKFYKIPVSKMVRFPAKMIIHRNEWTFNLYMLWDYLTFAYPIDVLFKLCGKNYNIRENYMRYWELALLIYPFTKREWLLPNNNVVQLWNSLLPDDKLIFPFDLKQIEWPTYLENCGKGIRRFLFKESEATLPSAKKLYQKLYWIHLIFKFFKCLLPLYLLYAYKHSQLKILNRLNLP